MRESELERLTKRIYFDPTTGCWIWSGSLSWAGYGKIMITRKKISKSMMAHRISWELHVGKIPKGMFVCHKCDTPACINPEHLFLGSQSDNIQDASTKNRIPRGEKKWRATATNKQVAVIKKLIAAGVKSKEISRITGVVIWTINHVRNRDLWKHV